MMPDDEDDDDVQLDDEFIITDIDGFVATMPELFRKMYDVDLDVCLSLEQCKSIFIAEHSSRCDDKIVSTPRQVHDMMTEFFSLYIGRMMSNLAARGIVDVAWDDTANEAVFSLTDAGRKKLQDEINNK